MKAVRIHGHGGVDQLRYEDSIEPKLASPTDVIVRLKAAGVTRFDTSIREGLLRVDVPLPHILGADGAGFVTEVGRDVKNIKTGDSVCLYPAIGCGQCAYCSTDREFMCVDLEMLGERRDGTYAEYVRIPARNCFPTASGLSFDEAAALPSSFGTAWNMLETNAELKPGETILINGVGGGVASAALQLAKYFGARTIVTSSSDRKLARAAQLGAAHGINYQKCDIVNELRALTGKRGVDVAIDCVGGDNWVKSLAALAKGGRLVTCGAVAGNQPKSNLQRIFWNQLKIFGSSLGSRNEFHDMLKFIEVSGAKPVLDRVFSLKDADQAQQRRCLVERKS